MREEVGEHLCEVDHDSDHRPIHRPPDPHRLHGLNLSIDQVRIHAKAMQASGNHVGQMLRQPVDVPRSFQVRQKQESTDQEEERLPIKDQAIDVPITQSGIGRSPRNRFTREAAEDLLRSSKSYHEFSWAP